MKLIALLALTLVFSQAHSAGLELPDYTPTQITERIYVIHGPLEMPTPQNRGFMNNPVIAISDSGVVIVDPGSSVFSGRMVLRQVKKLTDKPVTHVFGSHIHGDHWLGNHAIKDAYPEAQFYAHPVMIEMAKDGEANNWIELMKSLTEGATDGTRAVIPDNPLVDLQTFDLPGLPIRVHLTDQAHTKTDAMIEFVNESLVFLGDNALLGRIGRMNDGSFKGNVAALDRALTLETKWYVPGHGQTGGAEAAMLYRDYLDRIYQAAVKYSEEMMAPFEIKEVIEGDFSDYANWSGFEDEFGRQISLAVLEAEQDAF